MKTIDILKQAARWARRRKTAKQHKGIVREIMEDRREHVTVHAKAKFNTACWEWDTTRAPARHRIHLGEDFRDVVKDRDVRENDRQMIAFAKSLLRHEACHALYTTKDTSEVARLLAAEKIPFRLWNLFEDARIEHVQRLATKKGNRWDRFRWWVWTPSPEATDNPGTFFWSLVNREASSWKTFTPAMPKWEGKFGVNHKIGRFYRRAIEANDLPVMIQVLKDWIKEFPEPLSDMPRGSGTIGGEADPNGDVTDSEKGGAGASEGDPDHDVKANPDAPTDEELRAIDHYKDTYEGQPWARHTRVKGQVARNAAGKMESLMQNAGFRPVRTATSGSRLHIPTAITGEANAFRRNTVSKGRRKVVFLLDCSSSMFDVARQAKEMLWALCLLHRGGMIDLTVWLSGQGHARFRPEWGLDKLNELITDKGCESLEATMNDPVVSAELIAAHSVIVYTDAAITDAPINTKAWRAKGVDLIGVYVSPKKDERQIANMKLHFRRWFRADTTTGLAALLAQQIAK